MKLMDEVAGIVAARHCKTNIVTASVDAINFHRKIKKGKQEGRYERFNKPNEKGLICNSVVSSSGHTTRSHTIQTSAIRGLTHVIFYTGTLFSDPNYL